MGTKSVIIFGAVVIVRRFDLVVEQPTSSHLVQPIAWRRPDLGLNSKFDVCRTENLAPCAKTEG